MNEGDNNFKAFFFTEVVLSSTSSGLSSKLALLTRGEIERKLAEIWVFQKAETARQANMPKS